MVLEAFPQKFSLETQRTRVSPQILRILRKRQWFLGGNNRASMLYFFLLDGGHMTTCVAIDLFPIESQNLTRSISDLDLVGFRLCWARGRPSRLLLKDSIQSPRLSMRNYMMAKPLR